VRGSRHSINSWRFVGPTFILLALTEVNGATLHFHLCVFHEAPEIRYGNEVDRLESCRTSRKIMRLDYMSKCVGITLDGNASLMAERNYILVFSVIEHTNTRRRNDLAICVNFIKFSSQHNMAELKALATRRNMYHLTTCVLFMI